MTDRELPDAMALVNQLAPVLRSGDRAKIVDLIGQLVAARAPMGRQWQQLGYFAAGHGENGLARRCIDLFVAALGGGPAAQYQKVEFLGMLGEWREGYDLLRTLPEDVPDALGNAYSRGTSALNLGKREEARIVLEKVVRARPQSGMGWFALAMSVDFTQEAELTEGLIYCGRHMARADLAERVPYQYALGKMRAEYGEHALAFEAFARGAADMKGALAYDPAADRAEAAKAVEGYTAERIAAIAARQSEPTARTIFVAGLPRSGTTLMQQILTGHSAVIDGGETSRLVLLGDEVGGASHPALASYVETRGTAGAARLWDHWLDELFPQPGRIVDKTVIISRYLGLAAALLPDAPLIWMNRDPLDRAWSCFRTNFHGSAMPWSYDLRDIAAHFRIEDELLAQWQQILGERLLVVSYEALVSEPEAEIGRILAHCGLEAEAQVFAPHENKKPIATASMMQVRRPISRDSVGAAAPYRDYLRPFIDAYYG